MPWQSLSGCYSASPNRKHSRSSCFSLRCVDSRELAAETQLFKEQPWENQLWRRKHTHTYPMHTSAHPVWCTPHLVHIINTCPMYTLPCNVHRYIHTYIHTCRQTDTHARMYTHVNTLHTFNLVHIPLSEHSMHVLLCEHCCVFPIPCTPCHEYIPTILEQ